MTKYETTSELVCIDGEVKTIIKREAKGESEYTWWENRKVYPTPKPQPEEGDIILTENYDPSDNRLIRDAILQVSAWWTELGVTQNRLEHAYNNNGNKEENMTAAESRIRDTDIAREMVDYSNMNILQQAGVSILSQANQDRQNILQLLQ